MTRNIWRFFVILLVVLGLFASQWTKPANASAGIQVNYQLSINARDGAGNYVDNLSASYGGQQSDREYSFGYSNGGAADYDVVGDYNSGNMLSNPANPISEVSVSNPGFASNILDVRLQSQTFPGPGLAVNFDGNIVHGSVTNTSPIELWYKLDGGVNVWQELWAGSTLSFSAAMTAHLYLSTSSDGSNPYMTMSWDFSSFILPTSPVIQTAVVRGSYLILLGSGFGSTPGQVGFVQNRHLTVLSNPALWNDTQVAIQLPVGLTCGSSWAFLRTPTRYFSNALKVSCS